MEKRHRTCPLLRLLARIGWQRDPDTWTVPCRDGRGHRARLHVRLTDAGVVVAPSTAGPWALTPLQVGRLRGALRDAVLTFDRLAGSIESADHPAASATESPPPPEDRPLPRQRVLLEPLPRPSVAEIAACIAATTNPDVEVGHDADSNESNQRAGSPGVAA